MAPPSGQRAMVAGGGSECAVRVLTHSPGFSLSPIPRLQGHPWGETEASDDHMLVEPDP